MLEAEKNGIRCAKNSFQPMLEYNGIWLTNKDDVHPEGKEANERRENFFDVWVICAGRRNRRPDLGVAEGESEGHDTT